MFVTAAGDVRMRHRQAVPRLPAKIELVPRSDAFVPTPAEGPLRRNRGGIPTEQAGGSAGWNGAADTPIRRATDPSLAPTKSSRMARSLEL